MSVWPSFISPVPHDHHAESALQHNADSEFVASEFVATAPRRLATDDVPTY